MSKIKKRVVYLIGAGATEGSVQFVGYNGGTLMADLNPQLHTEITKLIRYQDKYTQLSSLVNEIVTEEIDIEQVITFLNESPSIIHREFANELRQIFEQVLKNRLKQTKRDLGILRFSLYLCLLDMYLVKGCSERLQGVLTTNYDEYIEGAAKMVYKHKKVDYGLRLRKSEYNRQRLMLLKLHGSFNWRDMWPIKRVGSYASKPLWIPPGIHKAKQRYPFSNLWGRARELLDCDILRIIGCRLSGNDWDLISLLFATQLTHSNPRKPYEIELIDSPFQAFRLQKEFPYLNIKSILEIEQFNLGAYISSELLGIPPKAFEDLTEQEKERLTQTSANWFRVWLEQMAEGFLRYHGENAIDTRSGYFQQVLQRES